MSNIRTYIHHQVRPDSANPTDKASIAGVSTKTILEELHALRAPLWTLVGGAHATGVSRLLEELARMRAKGSSSQETIRIVLPDEETKRIPVPGKATRQGLETFKALRHELWAASSQQRMRRRHHVLQASVRDPNYESLFGEVRDLLNQLPISRILFDNAHYLRQDTAAVKKLFQLRRVVHHPFVLIFGVRLGATTKTETIFDTVLKDFPGAQETLDPPKTLYRLAEDQLIAPIVFELLAGQYVLPSEELLVRAAEYTEDLKKAVARNWVRLDVLAMRIDEKLRQVDPRPRSEKRPGILTYTMLREILDKMLGTVQR